MPNAEISQITVPVDVSGTLTNVTFDIKDAAARQMIQDLGNALYWMGVTTTALTDGATTNPITINGDSVTAKIGGIAQYQGEEFAWNGSAWQSMGKANFGALAFKDSASATYQPSGTISITQGTDTTTTVNSITAVGTLPQFSVSGETLVYTPGTLPTKGDNTTVVTASGTDTAAFTGTSTTITVS